MIVTDLHDRERERYAQQAEKMARAASELAAMLRSNDDTGALIRFAMLSLCGSFMDELASIFQSAMDVTIPDGPPKK